MSVYKHKLELFQNYGIIPSLQKKVFNNLFLSLNKIVRDERLDFSFYPNPVDDTIIINSSEDIASFELVSLLGQSMFKVATEEQLNFHISLVSQGNYFLKVVTSNGATDTFRLLKK
jgi:hypothetical protein